MGGHDPDNRKNKEGWLSVFKNGLLFNALRDAFLSIQVMYADGGLYRPLYAEFLEEAASVTGNKELTALAGDYPCARRTMDRTRREPAAVAHQAVQADQGFAAKKSQAAKRQGSESRQGNWRVDR